ncbi:ABC transporter permease [Shewanella sp. Choline-02u-19]|uniref:ABC transporter permease n=1 Tax=unclassified Shewanella TaxID=196818 RepID=UPI000C34BDD2|nr:MULTISPECIES: FtsX-like permease family protein [unclassified Shewanella]PKG57018.1 ABC transporter permease [Shewanella sp. GutDb-MelDb]PKG76693.1 ABC transporter permease [Shewanella sp. GutCb]PKH54550.1 ABC transporter permease [Shewanella sp. Bg11-22]PKI28608.1 ABC transporter permease [Shewanella sp. Choline-02u-19]
MLQIKPILSTLMRNKSGPILLLIQIILSVAIVANASFIISERLTLMDRASGTAEEQVFDFRLYSFDKNIDLESQIQRDMRAIRDLPGVIDASTTSMVPLSGGGWSSGYTVGSSEETAKDTENTAVYYGDEHMLNTLGVELIEGRNFYEEEVLTGSPDLATHGIVSKAFAKATWGDDTAIGKTMYAGDFGNMPIKVVGVVDKLQGAWVNSDSLDNSVILNIKLVNVFTKVLVRAEVGTLAQLKQEITTTLLKDNRNRVVENFTLISEHRKRVYRNHELMATVLSMMVILLLLITSLGLAGMVMFNIERRTKQIGTRRALGAKKRDIISFFLVENYIICVVGGVIGGLVAVQLGQQLMTVYSLPKLELIYPIATIAGLLVLTTIAVILPARKAANISPAIATRSV